MSELQKTELKELPFIHNTRFSNLKHIFSVGFLSPTLCDVFNENLLYLFYGRPAYKVSQKNQPSGYIDDLPVSVVIKTGFDKELKRVYPFDSGAFIKGAYDAFIGTSYSVDDFLIEGNVKEIKRHISKYYDSNGAYLTGYPKDEVELDDEHSEAYYRLITTDDYDDTDDRCYSIEAQCIDNISINDEVDILVVPFSGLDDQDLMHNLKSSSIKNIETYEVYRRRSPSSYNSDLYEKIRVHLYSKGVL